MFVDVIGKLVVRPKRGGEKKRQLVLAHRIADAITHARFRSRIGEALESEGGLVIMRCLFGIADIKFDVIGPFERQKIRLRLRCFFRLRGFECRGCHKLVLELPSGPTARSARSFPNISSPPPGRKDAPLLWGDRTDNPLETRIPPQRVPYWM